MSPDWEAIRTQYVTSRLSLAEISLEIGLNHTYLKRKAAAEGWSSERKEYHEEVHQQVARKLLERAQFEAESILERNLVRAEVWRSVQAKLVAVSESVNPIDPITGLPLSLSLEEAKRTASVLKDVAVGLEKCFTGERMEMGQDNSPGSVGMASAEYSSLASIRKSFAGFSPEEQALELEKVQEALRQALSADASHNNSG